jgi:hypothetical protein
VSVVVVVVDMLDCSVDTHHCSVDTAELLHAYFFYVSAGRLFLKISYHTHLLKKTPLKVYHEMT